MASRIQGITVEIGGDITKLFKALGYYVSVAKRSIEDGNLIHTVEKKDGVDFFALFQKFSRKIYKYIDF